LNYSSSKEAELLGILADSGDANGLFFARKFEIARRNCSPDPLEERYRDCPDLSPEAEFHLKEMAKSGLVEELSDWGTDEGLQYRITRSGSERIAQSSPWRLLNAAVIWLFTTVKGILTFCIAVLALIGTLVQQIDQNLVCAIPFTELLDRCASVPAGVTDQ